MGTFDADAMQRLAFRTGDILLFSGKSHASESIKWVTLSGWSHVALVLRLPQHDFPCLWEATTDTNIACLDSGQPRPGVQLVPLARRVQEYAGRVACRQLDVELDATRLEALLALRRRLSGRGYESSTIELMTAAYDGPLGEQAEDLRELFCSELVAEAYQALGLIRANGGDKASNEYVPADFSERWERLPWTDGRLGAEILLRQD
ncbi:MAG TPA: hypothetical protein VLI06_12100 [Solimonas sp.]|nr:hypothetical protein [Solimonas sp.]